MEIESTQGIARNVGRWKPGQSGNPAGMKPGTRHAFSQAFVSDFHTVWNESGIEAVRKLAKTNIDAFVAIAARILPKDFELTVSHALPRALDETDMAILKAIKESLPSANSESPEAVLSFVLEAVRSHAATPITDQKVDD